MTLALYRKYRPASFGEVVGQEHVTEPLRRALAAGRINHAYLFSGPRGCGKTSCARIMARSLNCVHGPTADPCGECDSCQALAPEGPGSVDVIELDAASHGGVDDARELRDRAFFSPAESRYRVFIIDEAHMVTTQGFNALLKIVEEPPEHLIFIFATTEPDKVISTIRSRTHHYPFRLIPPSAMRELLERNLAAEGVAVEPAVLPLVIRTGGGSARDTQSVLDQLLAGAGSEGINYERAVALLGVTDVALIDDMVDALAADDATAVFDTVERLVEAGHDPRRFAADLLDRLRDLVLLRSVPDAAARELVSAPEDELTRMSAQAERLGPATLSRYAEIVHSGLLDMRGATAPRLLLELLCARMLLPAASEGEAGMLQRLERLERRVTVGDGSTGGGKASPQPRQPSAPATESEAAESTPPAQPEPQWEPEPTKAEPESAPAASAPAESTPPESTQPRRDAPVGGLDATAVRRVWMELLSAVRKSSRSTEAMLTNASVRAVEGSTLVLAHTAEPLARRLSEQRNADVIAAAMHEVLGGDWQVRCVHDGDGAARDKPNLARAQPPEHRSPTPAPASQPKPDNPGPPSETSADADTAAPPSDAPSVGQSPDEQDSPVSGQDTGLSPAPAAEPNTETDPDAAAHRLLSDQLGARRLE